MSASEERRRRSNSTAPISRAAVPARPGSRHRRQPVHIVGHSQRQPPQAPGDRDHGPSWRRAGPAQPPVIGEPAGSASRGGRATWLKPRCVLLWQAAAAGDRRGRRTRPQAASSPPATASSPPPRAMNPTPGGQPAAGQDLPRPRSDDRVAQGGEGFPGLAGRGCGRGRSSRSRACGPGPAVASAASPAPPGRQSCGGRLNVGQGQVGKRLPRRCVAGRWAAA